VEVNPYALTLCAAARPPTPRYLRPLLLPKKKNLLMGKKNKNKKIVPKRFGPIFCRGGLRLAGL
jgi:hypothetical protein